MQFGSCHFVQKAPTRRSVLLIRAAKGNLRLLFIYSEQTWKSHNELESPLQIMWEERFFEWPYLVPSGAIDTTIVRIRSPTDEGTNPEDYICKGRCKGPFVLFQAVVSFGTKRIVYFDGPHKGRAADVTIARQSIVEPGLLKAGERLLADAGYRYEGENSMIVAPGGRTLNMTEDERRIAGIVHSHRQIVERIFGRMKMFGLMNGIWRFDLAFLQDCVFVIAMLTNFKLLYNPLNS